MSTNLNRNNFSKEKNNNNNIIDFPFKNKKEDVLKPKETTLVINGKNNITNKFYSVDENKTKLNSTETDNILNFNNEPKKDDKNKMPPKPIALTILGIVSVCIVMWALFHKNAQQVFVGDKPVAIIKTNESLKNAEDLKELALQKLAQKEGANVEVNETVTFKPIRASKDEIVTIESATNKVAQNFTFKVEACVITVDGKAVATVKNEQEANDILNSIKNKYVNQDRKQVAEPAFVQNVQVENKYVSEKDIIDSDQALSILTANKDEGRQHTIKEGDTLFEIAINNDMSLKELLALNPNLTETTPLKIGSTVNLVVAVPFLSVMTFEEATYNMPIPKKVETVENKNEYKTYKKVLVEGKDGTKQVTAKITKINGVEDKRDILSEKVLTEPTVEKVEVGTLQTPPKKSIGSFIYPVRGNLSSTFGYRWGAMHKGIDLAAPSGTAIKASDGGTVVFSGWNSGGYGYMVKIDHGNGYQTVYAHNSKNAVSVGQKVAQGEVIAYVGNTGNSTGNHLHFEILQNGVAKNPLNFLK